MEITANNVVAANIEISAQSEVYNVSGVAIMKKSDSGYDYTISEGKVKIGDDILAYFVKREKSLDISYLTTDESEKEKSAGIVNEFMISTRQWAQGLTLEVKTPFPGNS